MNLKIYLLSILLFFWTKVFPQYYVSTFSGNSSGSPGFHNGPIDSATFNKPFGLCMDKHGNLFIAETSNCIRRIDRSTGIVSTYAGTGVAGWKDGFGDTAQFRNPSDICVDDSGNVYVSDFENHCIRKIDVNRMVTTVAGNGFAGYIDGNTNARFAYPRGICVDPNGNLYIGDSWNHRIRKIDMFGNVSTYAGGGTHGLSTVGSLLDALDTLARFYTPCGLTIDNHGNIYVADAYNHRIRKIDTSRAVTTLAGNGSTGQGQGGYQDGSFASAIFNTPTEVYYDTINNKLYISDTFSSRLRTADFLTSLVSNLAGIGIGGYTNGIDTIASFDYPRAIVADTSGNIFLSDFNNNSIRHISQNTGTGITEPERTEINIYPNPSSGLFSILFSKKSNRSIEVFDLRGRLVKECIVQGNIIIDLSSLESGIYFLKIKDEYLIRKLVLNRK